MCLAKIISLLKGKPLPTPPIPEPIWKPATEYQFASNYIYLVTNALGVSDHLYMWDGTYWVLSMADWQRVIQDALASLPKYLAEKFDCEDFAFLCMSRITEKYQINGCGVAVGKSPLGYHAFNIFVAWEGDKLVAHILEPQTGSIDPPGYSMDTVIFG